MKILDFVTDITLLKFLFLGKMGETMLHSVSTTEYNIKSWTECMDGLFKKSEMYLSKQTGEEDAIVRK